MVTAERTTTIATILQTAALAAAILAPAAAQTATSSGSTATASEWTTTASEWTATTGDKASRRYSPLVRLNSLNVDRLEVAWRWSSPDNDLVANDARFRSPRMQPGPHEVTPIKIGDRLFVTTGLSQLAAVDAGSGETLWVYDPESYLRGRPPNLGFVHRGASYWVDHSSQRPTGRLFYASGDAHLHAVDPYTGEPIGSFGEGGRVDLIAGLRRETPRRSYAVSSPVMVCGDVVVVGSSISDGATRPQAPPGDVRGFDARSGEQLWTFHSVPQKSELGSETWLDGAWSYSGNTNVWTLMSADEELGLVFLPFGTPTNDWYGGDRRGDNLFAESLVAVDCRTGERRWHFQAVHHGLWDYDLVTSPILGEITVDGRRMRIAAQLSKQGFLYVLDRVSGEPVWPIVERPVPPSQIAGELASPTQPFPTRPPPFEPQGMSEDRLIDFTPELLAEAKEILAQYDYGPLYTPPSERGTINLPGWAGGASWQGGAFDPDTGWLYVPSFTVPVVATLRRPDPSRSSFRYVGSIQRTIEGPQGLPLIKPPFSRLSAYDLNRGEIAWTVPLGDGPREHPALHHLDLPPLGSVARSHVLLTKELLLVSTGRTLYGEPEDEDPGGRAWRHDPPALRALDKRSGELLWSFELDKHADGSPMTYLHRGAQYVVLALGGRSERAELLALRLPPSDVSGSDE